MSVVGSEQSQMYAFFVYAFFVFISSRFVLDFHPVFKKLKRKMHS